jgi:hypothetical protein
VSSLAEAQDVKRAAGSLGRGSSSESVDKIHRKPVYVSLSVYVHRYDSRVARYRKVTQRVPNLNVVPI